MNLNHQADLLPPDPSPSWLGEGSRTSIPMSNILRAVQPFSLEWAAGFADGEGCIHIVKQRYKSLPERGATYRLGFTIVQNDLQVLQHFAKGMGIHHKLYSVKRRMGHNRQIYTLIYTGVRARELIRILQPYLVRKQLEAQAALGFWIEGKGGQRPVGARTWPEEVIAIRERYFLKLKALK